MAVPQNAHLPGYPQPLGVKYMDCLDHLGPASYTTGGETINASDVGMGGIDYVNVDGQDSTGTYSVYPIYTNQGGAQSSVKLKWVVTSTGAEVAPATNLSASWVRLQITYV